MDKYLVGKQYIGKSKLNILKEGKALDKDTMIRNICQVTSPDNKVVDYFVYGSFKDKEQEFDIKGNGHLLMITGVPLSIYDVNRFKWKNPKPIWSSFYQDQVRGYLFQIIEIDKLAYQLHL